jgi:hypothetical protein
LLNPKKIETQAKRYPISTYMQHTAHTTSLLTYWFYFVSSTSNLFATTPRSRRQLLVNHSLQREQHKSMASGGRMRSARSGTCHSWSICSVRCRRIGCREKYCIGDLRATKEVLYRPKYQGWTWQVQEGCKPDKKDSCHGCGLGCLGKRRWWPCW